MNKNNGHIMIDFLASDPVKTAQQRLNNFF